MTIQIMSKDIMYKTQVSTNIRFDASARTRQGSVSASDPARRSCTPSNSLLIQFADSPPFRAMVKQAERSAQLVELKIKRIAAIVDRLGTVSNEYTMLQTELVSEIGIASSGADRTAHLADALVEIEKSRSLMMSHLKGKKRTTLPHTRRARRSSSSFCRDPNRPRKKGRSGM